MLNGSIVASSKLERDYLILNRKGIPETAEV